jgi:hypothetical protein
MTKSEYKTQKKKDPAIKVFLLILLNITLFYFDLIKGIGSRFNASL